MEPTVKCLACGVEKDMSVKEFYPYPDDGIRDDEPVVPLFDLECEGPGEDWRRVTVCHHCLHRLDPDMWIDARGWRGINPVTPFEDLPPVPEAGES